MAKDPTGNPSDHNPSTFKDSITGSCLCGSITVTLNAPFLFEAGAKHGHICHCANCRKVAGSYAAANLAIDQDKVSIHDKDGALKVYEDKESLTGNTVSRFFCGTCGNPIKSETPARPGKYVIKMGIFPRIPEPEFETFAEHRHPWQQGTHGHTRWKIAPGGEKLE